MTITINVSMRRNLFQAIEEARSKEGKERGNIPSRSGWVRDAIEKKLKNQGVEVSS